MQPAICVSRRLVLTMSALLIAAAQPVVAAVIHVDRAVAAGGDGSSWASAVDRLTLALDQAQTGDEIWVRAGRYAPGEPGDSRDVTFTLRDGVALYGGFAGDETDTEQRDAALHETILTGDLNGDDDGTPARRDDNCHHVLLGRDLGPGTILDGFTITGGHATGPGFAREGGGGVRLERSEAVIRRCTFRGNTALSGGGLHVFAGTTIALVECLFADNRADVGAGLKIAAGSADILDCSFIGNESAGGGGGGGFIRADGHVTVSGGSFLGNDGGIASGGLHLWSSTATVIGCMFAANDARNGGGLTVWSDAGIIGCAFSRNTADHGGGIAAVQGSALDVVNCSFSGNSGGAVYQEYGVTQTIVNSILWGNGPEQVTGYVDPIWGTLVVDHCVVEGGWSGDGASNTSADPFLVQPGADDLRLGSGSPCLDAGHDDALPPGVSTDLAGAPRIQDGAVDVGAYEGGHRRLAPAALAHDLDLGDSSLLVLDGSGLDRLAHVTVLVVNETGADDCTMVVSLRADDPHREGDGFTREGPAATVRTTIEDGAFLATVSIPFSGDDLEGADPLALDVTRFDDEAGVWSLAVASNVRDSPGHDDAIGDRHVETGPWFPGATFEIGDSGVYWNEAMDRGFAWANVDRGGTLSLGRSRCPTDCAHPPDGWTAAADLVAILNAWGKGSGPYDVDGDAAVGAADLTLLLNGWGACR